MRRLIACTVAVLSLAVSPATADGPTVTQHDFRKLVRSAYAGKAEQALAGIGGKVRSTRPYTRSKHRKIVRTKKALRTWDLRKSAHRWWGKKRRAYRRVLREAKALTPYGPGPHGNHWAIPTYIIACESHFSWSAYNPSGARGAYQFLGWPVPWPVDSLADRIAHHRQAKRLSLSHWVCA